MSSSCDKPSLDPTTAGADPDAPLAGALALGSAAAIYSLDAEGRVTLWNRGAERLFGWRAEELLGKPTPLAQGERLADFLAVRACAPRGEPRDLELEHPCRDGSVVEVMLSVAPLRRVDGEVGGVVVTAARAPGSRERERRIAHLNRVQRATRLVNQLIVRERSAPSLVREAVRILVEARGYSSAFLVTIDEAGRVCDYAEAGIGERFAPFAAALARHVLPPCCAELEDAATAPLVVDRGRVCADCPLGEIYPATDALCVPLTRDGARIGYLAVAVERGLARDPEEQELLVELAGDLSLGLHGIAVQAAHHSTERALRASEDRYRALFEHMAAACCVNEVICEGGTPVDYRLLDVNSAHERVTGIPRAEAVGALASELYGTGKAPFLDTYAAVAETGLPVTFESFFEPLGRYLHVTVSSPGKGMFSTVFSDVSDRKRADEALRVEHDNVQAIMTSAPVALIVMDERELALRANAAAERLFRRSLAEMRECRCGDFLGCVNRLADPRGCGHTPRCAACPLIAAIRSVLGGSEGLRDLEYEAELEAEGAVVRRWLRVNVEPLLLAGRRVAIVALHDVTGSKLAADALARNAARLRSLLEIAERPAKDSQELLDFTLHQALALTGSRIGYIYHYDEQERVFTLNSWSRDVMAECSVVEAQTRYELDKTGIWGEVVRQRRPIVVNDFAAPNPLKKGYPEGHVHLARFLTVPVFDQERIVAVVGLANKETDYDEQDHTEVALLMSSAWKVAARLRAERAALRSETKARALYDRLPIPTFVWERREDDFVLVDFNEPAARMTKGIVAEWIGRKLHEAYREQPEIVADMERTFAEQTSFSREMPYQFQSIVGVRQVRVTYGYVPPNLVLVHTEDVTEQRQVEQQLRISQRLEAVGRLAGGIAHDFNNLLSVIITFAGFAIDVLDESNPARADVVEVQEAGRRAAVLVRQLLAFSRRQLLEPVVLNLNELVSGLESLLRRLLGEDIEIVVRLAPDLANVEADPGQLEQVLVNLAVNARDAMPGGGTLTIETANVDVGDSQSGVPPALAPGRFVRLVVSDTGLGMDEQTREHAFEPFFTTKSKEKGTGLGLSTVHGIVEQSGGHVDVETAVGEGSRFTIHLPAAARPLVAADRRPVTALPKAHETVLVVEDEDAVRRIAERVLSGAGYRVLSAARPDEALALCEQGEVPIDLLLTDVVMPQMSGRLLADRITSISPRTRVLYMSGYTDNAIVHHGVLEPGTRFIGKPFTSDELSRKVRETLDEGPAESDQPR